MIELARVRQQLNQALIHLATHTTEFAPDKRYIGGPLPSYRWLVGRSVVSLVAFSSRRSLVGLETINVYMSFLSYEHHIRMAIAFIVCVTKL